MATVDESLSQGDAPDITQRLIDEQETYRRATLVEKAEKLRRLDEEFALWDDLLTLSDAFTFDREDGKLTPGPRMQFYGFAAAFNMGLIRPSATACAYITLQQLRIIRAFSRAFCLLNPYWWAIEHNRKTYVIGDGHQYAFDAQKGKVVSDSEIADVERIVKRTCDWNEWPLLQAEMQRRADRDGEWFLQIETDTNEEGKRVLDLSFIEPLLVWDPPEKSAAQDVWFGCQFRKNKYKRAIGYYIRPTDYLGGTNGIDTAAWRQMHTRKEILHRKYNVDISSPRGIPTTYSIFPRLDQGLKTLTSMGRLVDFRAKIGLIRRHLNATLSSVNAYLGQKRGDNSSAAGPMRNLEMLPYGAVIDTNDATQYDFPTQNLEVDKMMWAVRGELQCAAAATGLLDAMISADNSQNSFASGMISEGPVDKTMRYLQGEVKRNSHLILVRAIQLAIEDDELPGDILERLKIEHIAPLVIARNRIQEVQADQLLVQSKAMSPQTMGLRHNVDPNVEIPKIKQHEKDFPPLDTKAAGGPVGNRQMAGRQKVTARPFRADDEPAPRAHPQRSQEGLEEAADSHYSQDKPAGEDWAMVAKILPDGWAERTKGEILALATENLAAAEYAPGAQGYYMGDVDGQQVWSVDMTTFRVQYGIADILVAGNSALYDWIPADRIYVDRDFKPQAKGHCIYHEAIEARLMSFGWAYARAHRMAGAMELEWLLDDLRPELADLKPKE